MAARRRPKAPRALLICCEGKTEEQYFNILLDFHRLPAYEYFKSMGKSISEIQKALHSLMPDEEFWPQIDFLVETMYGQL